MNGLITNELLGNAYTYKTFREMTDSQYAKGKISCEGDSITLNEYAQINVQRMMRLDKSTVINDEIKKELRSLKKKLIWLVIAEAWCGDVAHNLPVIAKIAEQSGNINLRIILRDKNPEIMNQYLTNGGKAIPKLICFEAGTLKELGTWGPRPAPAQKLAMELKTVPNITGEEKKRKIILWYAEDKTKTIQNEFLNLIKSWKN